MTARGVVVVAVAAAAVVAASAVLLLGGDDEDDPGAFCEVMAGSVFGEVDGRPVDVVIHIAPDVADGVLAGLERRITEDPGVAASALVDQQETYEEFTELFADSPEMIDAVSPGRLPPSLRVALTGEAAADPVGWAEDWEDESGVMRVTAAASHPLGPTVRSALLDKIHDVPVGSTAAVLLSEEQLDAVVESAPAQLAEDVEALVAAVRRDRAVSRGLVEVTPEVAEAASTIRRVVAAECAVD